MPFVTESVITGVFQCVVASTNTSKADFFVDFCKDLIKDKDCYFYMQSGTLVDQSEGFDSLEQLIKVIEEDTENTGVMMYFGDARKRKRSQADFRADLLYHLIVALQVLQKEGNLLLKVIGSSFFY